MGVSDSSLFLFKTFPFGVLAANGELKAISEQYCLFLNEVGVVAVAKLDDDEVPAVE